MTNQELYENLSVAGLTGDLHDIMKTIRPNISRNTIRLAFVRGGTTRLRRRVIQEGTKLYEDHRAAEIAGAFEEKRTHAPHMAVVA